MKKKILLLILLGLLASVTLRAETPMLSVPHGIYSRGFTLYITSPVAGVSFYYTDDGSDPREKGQPYDGSLYISSTAVIRAAYLRKDSIWSDVATASYIFPQSLLTQGNRPYGYPAYWGKYCQISGSAVADYEMDPEITRDATYASYVTEGILKLPIVSLVTDRDNLFSRENDSIKGGIYIYTGCPVGDGTGRGWERPVCFEMIGGPAAHDLTIDCCLKLHGGHGRLPEKNPKHAFRLHFKSDYGPKKLKYSVFGDRAPKKFNSIVLRTFFGYSWTHWDNAQRSKAQYTRDLWARETQAKMGDPISTGQYVHLFINGLYWGMYNLCERITDEELKKLGEACEAFAEEAMKSEREKDVKLLAQKDVALHDIIVQATGNQRLIQLVNNLSEQMYRYRFEYLKDLSQHEKLVEEHRVIYESLLNKDCETACAAARLHIDNQKKAIIRQIRLEKEKK